MNQTPQKAVRIPDGLEAAARAGRADLAQASLAGLIRAGLAVLAGWSADDVRDVAAARPGPRREPWKVARPDAHSI